MSAALHRLWGAFVFALIYGVVVVVASRIVDAPASLATAVVMVAIVFILAYAVWPTLSANWQKRDLSQDRGRLIVLGVSMVVVLFVARLINQLYGQHLTGGSILLGLVILMMIAVAIAVFELHRAPR